MSTQTSTVIHVRVPIETHAAMQVQAEADDRKVSTVARRALVEKFGPASSQSDAQSARRISALAQAAHNAGPTKPDRPARPMTKQDSIR